MTSKTIWGKGVSKATKQSALDKLAASGLSEEDALPLQLLVVENASLFAKSLLAAPAIIITYFLPDGAPVPHEVFWRARYLSLPQEESAGWEAQIDTSQVSTGKSRYRQPKDTPSWLYLPPNITLDNKSYSWEEVFKEEESIYAVEGEFKAMKACKEGLPTIAYGGVRSFSMHSSKGVDGVPPLVRGDELRGKGVRVVFDTDTPEGLKDKVYIAAQSLMLFLVDRGAVPLLITLPYEGKKTGLDDYLVEHSAEEFRKEILPQAQPFETAQKILKYTKDWGYIERVDHFVRLEYTPASGDMLLAKEDHFERLTGYQQVVIRRLHRVSVKDVGFEARYSPTPVSLAKAVLTSPLLSRFDDLVYRPGEKKIIEKGSRLLLNLWSGWRCEYEGPTAVQPLPEKKVRDHWVSLWHKGLDVVFGKGVERSWVEAWLLHPLRYPATRIDSYVLVWGEQGVGKTFFGEMQAMYVYGTNAGGPRHGWILQPGELDSDFNPYAYANSFLLAEEVVTSASRRDVDNKLKALITNPSTTINLKNKGQFRLENNLLFWGSSNSELAAYTSQDARRPLIYRAPNTGRDWPHWKELSAGFKSGEAAASLLHYARESDEVTKLLSTFDPKATPPTTQAKIEMAEICMYPEERWLRDLVADARDGLLSRTVVTAAELVELYRHAHSDEKQVNTFAMAKLLSRVGAVYVGQSPVRTMLGEQVRPWSLLPGDANVRQFTDKEGKWVALARVLKVRKKHER